MDDVLKPYPTEQMGQTAVCEPPSLLRQLKRTQAELNARLAVINEAIAALESNPEVAKVLELVSRAR